MNEIQLNSQDWFNLKLAPVLGARRRHYPGMKVSYKLVLVQGSLAGHEYVVSGPGCKPLGLEPYALRMSCNGKEELVADFLWKVASGKLPTCTFQYLLGPYTQYLIMTGQRPGYKAMFKDGFAKPAAAPSERLAAEFDKNAAIDSDYKKVAKKRSFDIEYVKDVLAERPHLLDAQGNPLKDRP
jgi:hypothetical protein